MVMPFYVAPEQMMQDKAEYAKKGIARGKSIVAMEYADGLIITGENPSASLSKISEIYDRIAFAGVGKYSEFENLRKAGIRYADLKGYTYSRDDVTIKSLANAYSETIGNIFTREPKPLEVEIIVVEVGINGGENSLYRIQYDGSITDHKEFVVIGGQREKIEAYLKSNYGKNLDLKGALKIARDALSTVDERPLSGESLEVAVLDRNRAARKFRKLPAQEIQSLLAG